MPPKNPFDVDHRVDRPTPKQDNPDVAKPDESFVAPSVQPRTQRVTENTRDKVRKINKYPAWGPGRGKAQYNDEVGGGVNSNF